MISRSRYMQEMQESEDNGHDTECGDTVALRTFAQFGHPTIYCTFCFIGPCAWYALLANPA